MTQGKAPRERPAPMPAANRPTRHAIRRSRHGYNPGITQKPERHEITTRPELFETAAPAGRGSAATDDPAGRVPQRQTASQRGGAFERTEYFAQHPPAGHQPPGVRRVARPQERIRDDRGAPERDEQRPQLDELFAGDACTGHGRAEFRTAHQPQDAAGRGFRVSQRPGRSQAAVPGAPARTPEPTVRLFHLLFQPRDPDDRRRGHGAPALRKPPEELRHRRQDLARDGICPQRKRGAGRKARHQRRGADPRPQTLRARRKRHPGGI